MSLLWDRMCSVRSQVRKLQLPHTLAWLRGWKLHAYVLCPETSQQVCSELQRECPQFREAKDPSEQVTFCPKPLYLLTSEDLIPFGLLAWASSLCLEHTLYPILFEFFEQIHFFTTFFPRQSLLWVFWILLHIAFTLVLGTNISHLDISQPKFSK